MLFRFFSLGDACTLDPVGEIEVGGAFPEAKVAVERHFDNIVTTLNVRQVLVLAANLGDAAGRVIAAEAVFVAHLTGKVTPPKQVRSLIWLVEEYVPKHSGAE